MGQLTGRVAVVRVRGITGTRRTRRRRAWRGGRWCTGTVGGAADNERHQTAEDEDSVLTKAEGERRVAARSTFMPNKRV